MLKHNIKSVLKRTSLFKLLTYYRGVRANRKQLAQNKEVIRNWKNEGRPIPAPHIYKILTIKYYAKKFSANTLIETGTYLGETIETCKYIFKTLISIELGKDLFELATQRFAGDRNITIYQGNSGEMLQDILLPINEPCLFWLDGHYSEGITAKGDLNTPILAELKHIFEHSVKNHVILIDDARCFNGKDDYPSLQLLQSFVNNYDFNLQFLVEDDIIRIHR